MRSPAYGAATSLVMLLIWIYSASQIVLFGAELTHILSERRSRRNAAPSSPPYTNLAWLSMRPSHARMS